MKKMSKWLAGICIAALLLGMAQTAPALASEPQNPGLEVETPDNKVLTYQYQKAQDFVLNLKNTGNVDLKNIHVSPKLKDQGDQWPFRTEYQSYEASLSSLAAGESGIVKFPFTQRADGGGGRYQLFFSATAADAAG